MKTLVLLLPHRKPAQAWKKGLKYALQYDVELVGLVLIEKQEYYALAQKLVDGFLAEAEIKGVVASGEIVLRDADFDLLTYKSKYNANLLIM